MQGCLRWEGQAGGCIRWPRTGVQAPSAAQWQQTLRLAECTVVQSGASQRTGDMLYSSSMANLPAEVQRSRGRGCWKGVAGVRTVPGKQWQSRVGCWDMWRAGALTVSSLQPAHKRVSRHSTPPVPPHHWPTRLAAALPQLTPQATARGVSFIHLLPIRLAHLPCVGYELN